MTDVAAFFDRKRRRDGLLLGALTGLIYGLVSQWINHLFLSGIAFYQPPFGPLGNTLMWILIGGLLGALTTWSGGSLFGVLIGSLVAGLLLQVSALLTTNLSRNLGAKLIGLAGFYVPFAAMAIPLLGLLRVAVNQQRDWYDQRLLSWKRLRMPLLLAVIAAGIGALALFPENGRVYLSQMDRLVRQGLQAPSAAGLPQPLQDPLVGAFHGGATPSFTLELDQQNLLRYQIPYTARGNFQPAVVLARFSSGWALACLYVSPGEDPFCKGFTAIGELE